MAKVKFFVEGDGDRNFIIHYCNIIFNKPFTNKDFVIMGSWSGYKTGGTADPDLAINTDAGGTNILFVDADNDFKKRADEITFDKGKLSFKAELFLFPNNKDQGNIETVLTEIAVDRKLIECFRNYETCVKNYNMPLEKSRIYAYLDTLLHPYVAKPKDSDLRLTKNCDFSNNAHWDLKHAFLQPLHDFLQPIL